MANFFGYNKKMKYGNEKKLPKEKIIAIIFTVVATIGYLALFVKWLSWLKYFILGTFGIFSYVVFSAMYIFSGLLFKKNPLKPKMSKKLIIVVSLALLSILVIFHMAFSNYGNFVSYGSYLKSVYESQVSVGGVLLGLLVYPFQKYLNVGAYIIWIIALIICVVLTYNYYTGNANSKISWSMFSKTNSKKSLNKNIDNKDFERQNVQQNNHANIKQNTANQSNVDTINQFGGYQQNSVGMGSEVRQETSKEIAMRKLGLDRINNQQYENVDSNQMDMFKKNYMNAGGTVFSQKKSFEQADQTSQYAGTFGYSNFSHKDNSKDKFEEKSKYDEYRKFMGYSVSQNDSYSSNSTPSYEQTSNVISSNSTESNDEKLFGKPEVETYSYSSTENNETKENKLIDDTNKTESFLDRLSNDNNKEVKLDNVQIAEDENKTEDNLSKIFDNNIGGSNKVNTSTPKEDLATKFDIPKSFLMDKFTNTKTYENSNNFAETQIKKSNNEEQPKTRIKPYRYKKPSLDLLTTVSTDPSQYGGNFNEIGGKIVDVLASFKIPSSMIGVTSGPAVTRYEFELAPNCGISVSKVPAYQNDIQMAIATSKNIMIQAPIPGMKAFGIEVPNDKVSTVSLREILESDQFKKHPSPCAFGLGKEINGSIDVCAVNKMPHVLIAGSTGSGKSVCLNALIISILYRSSPEDVKFILIDPKRVEFSIYQNLPHLIIPDIISEPKKADNALAWAIKEMEKRYKLIEKYRVRNIDDYNQLQEVKDRFLPKMPFIVIIMDEFADMIGECKEIEEKVAKLAAKARAAGIHLVLATQRPSVDVLSGTAKNNFPARIAFALSSQQDSRTILNYSGAENLLGRGDMLYLAPGSNEGTKRIQGCYVSDAEVRSVVDFVINNNEPDFDESIEAEINKRADATNSIGVGVPMGESIETDEEMMEYAKVLLKEFIRLGRASSSLISRQLRFGFNKSARILDWLARKKFISESDGTSKPRTVYITKDQYIELFGDTDFDDHD